MIMALIQWIDHIVEEGNPSWESNRILSHEIASSSVQTGGLIQLCESYLLLPKSITLFLLDVKELP